MTLQRSYSAGETDYTGADLSDILIHLHDWRKNTQETIRLLDECRGEVEQCQDRLDDPNDIICFINYFVVQCQKLKPARHNTERASVK